ncbi:galactose oxidase [Gigaspora margarita]|uniref:Galactose oxidase n=1 Tax=Gigaspora margarita TaxID=4874 RepID=A0A8H4AY53_GIGMA|nr:galactose oxidase [Gigaspora margarita]
MSYFNFYIFTFFLNFIFIFANFIPASRFGHTPVLVDKKLYISGEYGLCYWKDFFYLDVSQHFTIAELQWNDLTFTGPILNIGASMCSGGSNNDLIFTFGGGLITTHSLIDMIKVNNSELMTQMGEINPQEEVKLHALNLAMDRLQF